MKTAKDLNFQSLPTKYQELIAFHAPRVIHDAVDYENTTAIIDAMAGHKLTRDQDDYLELLSQIVEAYEDEQITEPKPAEPAETLRFLLRESNLTGDNLAELLDVDRSQAFKILKGTRALTAQHIKKVAERFHVSADLFMG